MLEKVNKNDKAKKTRKTQELGRLSMRIVGTLT